MKKFMGFHFGCFLILLFVCSSCKMNTSSSSVDENNVRNNKVKSFNQYTGRQILDTLGKVYGNDPGISGLNLETPNCPDFIEGIYFDKSDLVFQVRGDTVKIRQELESASGSSFFRLELIGERNYSQKDLFAINEELVERFNRIEEKSVRRNISGFGVSAHHISIDLMVNTPEKQKEFREKVMDSPAFRFMGPEVPVINEKIGVNDTLGISIRPEYPVFSTESEEIKFILDNRSGTEVICGDEYVITFEDEKGIWRELPINDFFNLIAYVVEDNEQRVMKAFLYPDVYPSKPGRYRFFYNVRRNEQHILMMAEFRLSSDENELKTATKTVLPRD